MAFLLDLVFLFVASFISASAKFLAKYLFSQCKTKSRPYAPRKRSKGGKQNK